MSAQPLPSRDDGDITDHRDGPGRRLCAARQTHGLKIEDIASQLHLHPTMIGALERDDYDALPGTVFVTGYVRNYARIVGLDPEPLLDAFRAAHPEAELPRPRVASADRDEMPGSRLAIRLTGAALIVALAGLAWIWWQNQGPAEEPPMEKAGPDPDSGMAGAEPSMPAPVDAFPTPAPAPPMAFEQKPSQSPTTSDTVEVATGPETPIAATTDTDAPPPGAAVETVSTASAAVAEQPSTAESEGEQPAVSDADDATEEPDSAAGEADAEVVMTFSGPCWVDIRDQDRKFKLFGEMRKGDRHVLEGTPPYSIIIGNTSAVEITVAGVPFALDTISRGNVARFTLDPSQMP